MSRGSADNEVQYNIPIHGSKVVITISSRELLQAHPNPPHGSCPPLKLPLKALKNASALFNGLRAFLQRGSPFLHMLTVFLTCSPNTCRQKSTSSHCPSSSRKRQYHTRNACFCYSHPESPVALHNFHKQRMPWTRGDRYSLGTTYLGKWLHLGKTVLILNGVKGRLSYIHYLSYVSVYYK